MSENVDILIAGSGLIGMSLSAALAETGYKIGLIGQSTIPAALPASLIDQRIYALSPKNLSFVAQISAQSNFLREQCITPVQKMCIMDSGSVAAQLHLEAWDIGIDALAYIVEERWLMQKLAEKLCLANNIIRWPCDRLNLLDSQPSHIKVVLTDGQIIHTQLLVGADGSRSWIRNQIGGPIKTYDYKQRGIVATFQCEKPHNNIAYQWFSADGIMAWLPLSQNRISLVWSVDASCADALLIEPGEKFTQRVTQIGKELLGKLTLLGTRSSFPLYLTHVPNWVRPRIALVGDAAHTLHPLAGQGLNAGLGDVNILARLLLTAHSDPGRLSVLRGYERARRESIYKVQGLTHLIQRLFNNTNPVLSTLRQFGLRYTDSSRFLKRQLIKAALSL